MLVEFILLTYQRINEAELTLMQFQCSYSYSFRQQRPCSDVANPPLSFPFFPSLPSILFLPPSLLLPSLSTLHSRPPLEVGTSLRLVTMGLGGAHLSYSSTSGRSQAAKRILAHFRRKFEPFWVHDDETFAMSLFSSGKN